MCDKIPYTKQEAEAARKGMGRNRHMSVDVYRCRHCGDYHLTSRGNGTRMAPTKTKFRFDPTTMLQPKKNANKKTRKR